MRYSHCTNAELRKFCTDRGIQVVSPSPTPGMPLKRRDYFSALKNADAAPKFRFLFDLPAELRNHIYSELLVCNNSFSCHPQILATCKLINDQASSILYVDNLIEIKIWPDGVFAHGKRCGKYTPYSPSNYVPHSVYFVLESDIAAVVWPSFLRRAQFIKISLSHNFKAEWSRCRFLQDIFNSLCSFLMTGHQLLSLQVDTTCRSSESQHICLDFDLYAAHLLGGLKVDGLKEDGLKELKVEGPRECHLDPLATYDSTRQLLETALPACVGSLRHFLVTLNTSQMTTKDHLLLKFLTVLDWKHPETWVFFPTSVTRSQMCEHFWQCLKAALSTHPPPVDDHMSPYIARLLRLEVDWKMYKQRFSTAN